MQLTLNFTNPVPLGLSITLSIHNNAYWTLPNFSMKFFNKSFVVKKSKFLIKRVFPSPTSLFFSISELSPFQAASFFGLSSSPEPFSTSESEASSSCSFSASLSSSSPDVSFFSSFFSSGGWMSGTSTVLLFKVAYCCFGIAQSIAICLPTEK